MATPTATTATGPKTIVSTLKPGADAKLTKADKRKQALAAWRAADDRASVACDERKALKDDALSLCEDGKTYRDADGHQYLIQKTTDSTDYSGTLKWALGASNPLDLDAKQLKALRAKLDDTKKPKAHTTPIKRLD